MPEIEPKSHARIFKPFFINVFLFRLMLVKRIHKVLKNNCMFYIRDVKLFCRHSISALGRGL